MRAKAFSPAHITGFFKAELDGKEPNQLGSLGAGFSIQKGVKTTVNVRSKTEHDINNYAIRVKGFNTGDIRVSEYVLNEFLLDGKYFDITHEIDVPVGYGFGCSGAVGVSLAIAFASRSNWKINPLKRSTDHLPFASTSKSKVPAVLTLL